jgi:hypothetical protein
MSMLKNYAIRRHVDGFHKLGPCQFKASLGGDILRITGDPEGIELELPGEWLQQAKSPSSISMTTELWMHKISDMASIPLHVDGRADSQIDHAHLFTSFCVAQMKVVGRDLMDWVSNKSRELEVEVSVLKRRCHNWWLHSSVSS